MIMKHDGTERIMSYKKETKDYVILLHGLNRTRISMKRIERNLGRHGYEVINADYPSSRFSIGRLADEHLSGIIHARIHDRSRKVHFVTHSMGGIILRHYLGSHPLKNLGRVVMLGPPNNGSEIADRFKENILYRALTGPAGQQLGTRPHDLPVKLGPVRFELGVIAGDVSLNPYFSRIIDEASDGVVSIESTKADGMNDFIVVHSCHTFIMQNREVVKQVVHFLKTGAFQRIGVRPTLSTISRY